MSKTTGILIVCASLMYGSYSQAAENTQASSENNQDPITTIIEDIQLLSEKEKVSEAAERLINRGTSILKQAHEALESPETGAQKRQALILILANITDQSSIIPIIKAAENHPDKIIQLSVISSFKKFAHNIEIESYVYKVLSNKNNDARVLSAALDYLANHPDNKDKQWAELYSSQAFDIRIRSTALYLGGMIGIEGFKDKIMETFKSRKKSTGEVLMLIALTELTTPEEFNTLIKTEDVHLSHDKISAARLHYLLKHGDQQQKSMSASKILHKGPRFMKQEAIRYLIETGNAEALSHSWMRGDKAVKHMLQKKGLAILVDEKGAMFTKSSNKVAAQQPAQIKPAGAEKPSIDGFYRDIFSSLKNKDRRKFKSVAMLTRAEFSRHITSIAPAYKQKSGIIKQYKDQFKKSQEIVLKAWDEIYNKGLQHNIDWAEARYVTSAKQTGKYGYNKTFLITHKGHYYKISVPTSIFIEGKWKLQSQLQWLGSKMRQNEARLWSQRAAENGDTISAKELEILNNRTKSGKIPILRMLSSYENALAQYELYGQLKISKNSHDNNEAIDWLIRSALNKYSKAQYELSQTLADKWYKTKSRDALEASKNNLLLSARQNYVLALNKVAENYVHGTGGFELDLDKAITNFKTLLALDPAMLSGQEANRYTFLQRDIEDKVVELTALASALKAGDPETLTKIALEQLEIDDITNNRNGLKMLTQAAGKQYPQAQYHLGLIYAKGREVAKKDLNKAIDLWFKASQKNHNQSRKELAYSYINGKYGIQKNAEKALPIADKLAAFYVNNPADDYYEKNSARIWRVHACNLEMEIARKKDPAFVVPRVKTGRCKGL